MADESRIARSQEAFATLCRSLDGRGWNYKKDEESLAVKASARGNDLSIDFIIRIHAERNLATFFSVLPFSVQEDKRVDMTLAVSAINIRLVNGSFDFDITNGKLVFRMTNCFLDSTPSEALFQYMVMCSCQTVDAYNDKLLMVATGAMSLEQFMQSFDQ